MIKTNIHSRHTDWLLIVIVWNVNATRMTIIDRFFLSFFIFNVQFWKNVKIKIKKGVSTEKRAIAAEASSHVECHYNADTEEWSVHI